MKKRGQVTIFIILGILLLIALALVILFREEITIFKPERVVPTEIAPLVLYGDNCLEQVSEDALRLLGAQGGYIYLPNEINNNPLAHINTGVKIPYWQYITENRIPSIPLMEAHLSMYIEEHLNDCLNNFQDFEQEFDITPIENPDVTTTIADRTVIFEVNYPLEVRNKEGTKITDFSEFQATSSIKLKRVYEVAKKIMETESAESKIEKLSIDLLALDPDIPLSGVDFTCAQKIWHFNDVQNKFKTLLRTNLPSVRIEKTDYSAVPTTQPYIQNHYVWDVTEANYPDIKANIQYNEINPTTVLVSPRDGNLLKSGQQKGADVASFVCIQMWKFTYSFNYPVVVTVEDQENNYALNFAFDVKVNQNRPDRELLSATPSDFTQYDATEEAYCDKENIYGNNYMKIYTFDNVSEPGFSETHYPINKVNITFTCLKYTCPMGQSQFQQGGALSALDTRFPQCANGIVRGNKQGYKQAETFVTPAPNKEVNLYLTPVKTFTDYTIAKYNSEGTPIEIKEDETAFITINFLRNNTVEHTTTGTYPAQFNAEQIPLELLAEGNFPYQLEIYLMNENNVVGGWQGNWTPDWSELKNAHSIEFPVIFVGEPNTEAASINLISTIKEKSPNFKPILK